MTPAELDLHYMREALKQAHLAAQADEVPVGAVLVAGGRVIARAHNQVELLHDATAHAEMLAITGAMASLSSKYLPDCTLYVTLEPCVMCAGALRWAQLGAVVYGASDHKFGYSQYGHLLHPATILRHGVLATECSTVLKDFFKQKR